MAKALIPIGASADDKLLTSQDTEEALSRVYARALAAAAGYVVLEQDFDRDGVDLIISAGGAMRPSVALQLKATIGLGKAADGRFRYSLKRRNYDLLREPSQTPRLLMLLSLPSKSAQWLSWSPQKLVLQRCAYWVNLLDAPDVAAETAVTINVPEANLLSVDNLRLLMEMSRGGRIT